MKHVMGAVLISMVVSGTVCAAEASKEELAQSPVISSTAIQSPQPLPPELSQQDQAPQGRKHKTSQGHGHKKTSRKHPGRAPHHRGQSQSNHAGDVTAASDRQ